DWSDLVSRYPSLHPYDFFFFVGSGRPRRLHSFPTRRSSDLRGRRRHGARGNRWSWRLRDRRRALASDQPDQGRGPPGPRHRRRRSEEHTSELQSLTHLGCRLLLEKKNKLAEPSGNETHTSTI